MRSPEPSASGPVVTRTVGGARLWLLGFVLAACLVPVIHASRTHAFRHYLSTQRYEDRYYLPPPDALRVAAIGYDEALSDMVWIAMLANFGQELKHRGEARYIFHYGDAALALDPYFKRVYTWVGTVSLYRQRAMTAADARRAGGYLEEAAKRFPTDGELMWLLAAHYLYELPPVLKDRQRKQESKRRGAEYLQAATLLGAGPPWMGLTAASGLEQLGKQDQAIRLLSELYMTVEDPDIKQRIATRLKSLKDASFVEAMARTEVKLRQAKAANFPYLDETLFLLVGHRPPFDGAEQLKRYFDPVPLSETETEDAP